MNDTDSTGVNALFKKFKKKYSGKEAEDIVKYINSEYDTCCNYVHSNIKANIDLLEYLKDIANPKGITDERQMEIINRINIFLDKAICFNCFYNYTNIGKMFYKRKNELLFFIGQTNYEIYRSNIDR